MEISLITKLSILGLVSAFSVAADRAMEELSEPTGINHEVFSLNCEGAVSLETNDDPLFCEPRNACLDFE
ncbi:MAG: hypothetical protein AAF636_18695 [Pseudomonadota bacterium]